MKCFRKHFSPSSETLTSLFCFSDERVEDLEESIETSRGLVLKIDNQQRKFEGLRMALS